MVQRLIASTTAATVSAPTTVATTPATTEAENEACDHGEHDYGHNNKKHSHPNSPFTGFPRFRLQSTLGCSAVTTRSGMVKAPGLHHAGLQASGFRYQE